MHKNGQKWQEMLVFSINIYIAQTVLVVVVVVVIVVVKL